MTLAFAGTAPFGAAILAGLIAPPPGLAARPVSLVISQPDRPAGRGRKVRSPAVAQLARDHGLELVQPERMHEETVLGRLRELGVTTIVVAAFGQMVREPLLSEFLMLNVHGSLLPAYRGAAPIERSIMEGHTETGVCIMKMDVGLDTGPVAHKGRVPIGPEDDAGMVFGRCGDVGVRLLHQALDEAEAGKIAFTPQPEDGATYAHKITAEDRALDLSQGVQAVHDRVRALSPHIGAHVQLASDRLTLWRTSVVREAAADDALTAEVLGEPGRTAHDQGRLLFGCADGALEVLELQPAGKRRMPAGDWLRGLREQLPQAEVSA